MKIKISGFIKNKDLNTKKKISCIGLLKNDIISYKDTEYDTKITIKKEEIIIYRKSKEYESRLSFKENETTKMTYRLNEQKSKIELEILTTSLKINDNSINIMYLINDNEIEYEIKYKEV